MSRLDLFLFHATPELTRRCADCGIDGIVLDLERRGKEDRQSGFDTQISVHSLADLAALRASYGGRIICRVNGGSRLDASEIRRVLDLGADELLVPMIDQLEQVHFVRSLTPPGYPVGLMVETRAALELASSLAALEPARVYVGFNDLAISCGYRNIFRPLAGDTLSRLRAGFPGAFGFAGLTDPSLGTPIPSHLLLAEMKRLGASFTFLRRSFYRDLALRDPARIVAAIRKRWHTGPARPGEARRALIDRVRRLDR